MVKPKLPSLSPSSHPCIVCHRHWWVGLGGGAIAATLLTATLAPAQALPHPLPVLTVAQASSAPAEPTIPPLPEAIPESISPAEAGIVSPSPDPGDDVGVGHLRPADLSSLDGNNGPNSPLLNANWLRGVALPIYPSPESEHWGWLVNGWLIPNDGTPIAVGRDATFSMVRTDRRLYTFPVLEIRPDGWFRFQYTPAGSAWAHRSHLDLGAVELTVETWEAYLPDALRVEFRRPGLSQPMRLGPSSSAPLQALVGPNSIIQPMAMEGDWLRVRVTQPALGCAPLPGSSTAEGWVRWRSESAMPLVWFPASQC